MLVILDEILKFDLRKRLSLILYITITTLLGWFLFELTLTKKTK